MLSKMDTKSITEKIRDVFETHKNRLGKHNGSLFDTNVGKETFERVLKGLKKYNGWEETKTTSTDVFYDDTNGIRISSDEDTGEQIMVQKIKVVKEDFKSEPLDVRFSISREIPTHGSYDMDRKRSSGDSVDMDSEDAASYQIELEIVKPSDVGSYNDLFNILHKVNDLSKLI